MPLPPPPPPPGPLSVAKVAKSATASSTSSQGDRSALLLSIRQGKSLRKVETNDRSAPQVAANKDNNNVNKGNSNVNKMANGSLRQEGSSNQAPRLPGIGGLFADGMPKLKPTQGGVHTGRIRENGGVRGGSTHDATPQNKVGNNTTVINKGSSSSLSSSSQSIASMAAALNGRRNGNAVVMGKTINSNSSLREEGPIRTGAKPPMPISKKPQLSLPSTTNSALSQSSSTAPSPFSVSSSSTSSTRPTSSSSATTTVKQAPPPPPQSSSAKARVTHPATRPPPPPNSSPHDAVSKKDDGSNKQNNNGSNKLASRAKSFNYQPRGGQGSRGPSRDDSALDTMDAAAPEPPARTVSSAANLRRPTMPAPAPPKTHRAAPIKPPSQPPPPPPTGVSPINEDNKIRALQQNRAYHTMHVPQVKARPNIIPSEPPPPPTRRHSLKGGSKPLVHQARPRPGDAFEQRVQGFFRTIQFLPPPEPFEGVPKTYPSRSQHQLGNRQTSMVKRNPPPPPPPSQTVAAHHAMRY